jgi:hypothetical protein
LACNPDVQKRLREEVDCVTGEHSGQLDLDVIQGMEYLDMAIQGDTKFRCFLYRFISHQLLHNYFSLSHKFRPQSFSHHQWAHFAANKKHITNR